jgi:hypothetical protein
VDGLATGFFATGFFATDATFFLVTDFAATFLAGVFFAADFFPFAGADFLVGFADAFLTGFLLAIIPCLLSIGYLARNTAWIPWKIKKFRGFADRKRWVISKLAQ